MVLLASKIIVVIYIEFTLGFLVVTSTCMDLYLILLFNILCDESVVHSTTC